MSQVHDWQARLGAVPVDKGHRSLAAPDGVPWHQVAVPHDVSGRPRHRAWHPHRAWRRQEAPLGVVTLPQQAAEPLKPAVLKERRGTRAHAGTALDEGKDLAIALYAENVGSACEASLLQVAEERMNRSGPPALPSEDGIANSDGLRERATRQRHLAGHDKHAS